MAAIQDPAVEKLFGLLPTTGGNNSGKPARTALVSKLKESTPGRHTYMEFRGAETFRAIFFPNDFYSYNWKSAPYEGDTSLTTLDNNWWADFSVAVLAQAMYNLTSDLREELKNDDINNAVKSKNSELKTHCMAFYAKVFCETFAKAVCSSIKNKTSAKAQYISALTSDAWITAKKSVASEGMWTDAAWELYHHWVKLHLLGASNAEIDGVIKKLSSKELMIPPEVGPGKWTSYTAWMNPAAITWKDIQGDATNGILRSEMIYIPSYDHYMDPPFHMYPMEEENSFDFTARGQPGSRYRDIGGGGGSCFTGNTKVLMGNGTLQPIRSVEVGDEVFTLQGPRRVAVKSTPTRKKRHLYSLNGYCFRFTETHPFVTPAGLGGGEDGATFTAVSPRKLANLVPTLSRLGIAKMEPGPTIVSLQNKQPQPTPVHLVEEHPLKKPESEEELLYDLILEPTEAGFPHYVVGDDSILVLVASEVPRIELAPFATITILKALQEAADQIEHQPLPVNLGEPPSKVPHVFQVLSPTKAMVSNVDAMAMNLKQAESCDVSDMLSVFVKEDTGLEEMSYRRELGDAYEQIAALHGEEIDAIVDLGFRSIGQEEDGTDSQLMLSISLLDVIFHDLPRHSPGQRLAVNIEARTEERTDKALCEESDVKISSNFARHFRQIVYFQNVDIHDGSVVDLHFQVHNVEESHPLPYTANVVVPWKIEHNYRMFEAILHENGDQEVGLLRFDVRQLSSNAMQEEQRRSETWEDGDKQAYALALGKCYGEYLKEHLPNVRSHGLVAVTKRPWFKLPCFNCKV